jgi:hypothetical protein
MFFCLILYNNNMSNTIDALAYVNFPNNVTDQNELYALTQKYLGTATSNERSKYLDTVLSDTTIKRACCLGNTGINGQGVNVRIPVPTGFNINNIDDPAAKKFGYIDKNIKIPSSMCNAYPTYTVGQDTCNEFYSTYCQNMKDLYTLENGGNFDPIEFAIYKPECACYGQVNTFGGQANVSPMCYMPGCDPGSAAYLDPTSRQYGCTQSICQAIINYSEFNAGHNIDINNQIIQECGKYIPPPTKPPTPDHTTTKPPTPDHTTTKPPTPDHTTTKPPTPDHTTTKPPTPDHTTTKPPTPDHTTTKPPTPDHTTTPPPSPIPSSESWTRYFTRYHYAGIVLLVVIICLLSTSSSFLLKKKGFAITSLIITLLLLVSVFILYFI